MGGDPQWCHNHFIIPQEQTGRKTGSPGTQGLWPSSLRPTQFSTIFRTRTCNFQLSPSPFYTSIRHPWCRRYGVEPIVLEGLPVLSQPPLEFDRGMCPLRCPRLDCEKIRSVEWDRGWRNTHKGPQTDLTLIMCKWAKSRTRVCPMPLAAQISPSRGIIYSVYLYELLSIDRTI